jgi:hypothetical protein
VNGASTAGPSTEPRWQARIAVGALASLALHVSFLAYVGWVFTAPDVGLSFELPTEVEFGLTEAVEAATAPEPEPVPEEPPAGSAVGVDTEGSAEKPAPPRKEPRPPPQQPSGPEAEFGTRALPPGAQLALRMNMARIRNSPLAPNVRRLLANIPDWQAVLGGSGLEPVDDLERVLIASPNLHRSRVVIGGRHEGDPALPRDIVARMAETRGKAADWTTAEGIPVAPWHDDDTTERLIALIGPGHFAISRPEDLPRVLAIAQARQARKARANADSDSSGLDPTAWGEALLSLGDDEAITLEVEGARNFVRGPMAARFPTRLRIAAVEHPSGLVRLATEGSFDSTDEATAARDFAEQVREAYARNVFLQLSGLGNVLKEAELSQDGSTLRLRLDLNVAQVRLLLGYIEGFLSRGQPPPRPGRPSPPPAPEPVTEAGAETEPGPGTLDSLD